MQALCFVHSLHQLYLSSSLLLHLPSPLHASRFTLHARSHVTRTPREKHRERERDMEKKVLAVCCIVGFLGLLSAATGFGAEAKRIKFSQVLSASPTECVYPRSPALALGLIAALALLIAQIIINVATGCICCRRSPRIPDGSWRLALASFVLSWFTFVIAFLLLLTGAALNDQHGEESTYFGNYYCYVVKPGVFAGGALLSFASVAFGIVYYVTLTTGKNTSNNAWGDSSYPNQGGIAMGQPQIPVPPPQSSQEPVFVHEDTYIRRQFT